MLDRAVAREALLEQDLAQVKAKLRLREQQLFGRKAEAGASTEKLADSPSSPSDLRPATRRTGPGRRDIR